MKNIGFLLPNNAALRELVWFLFVFSLVFGVNMFLAGSVGVVLIGNLIFATLAWYAFPEAVLVLYQDRHRLPNVVHWLGHNRDAALLVMVIVMVLTMAMVRFFQGEWGTWEVMSHLFAPFQRW